MNLKIFSALIIFFVFFAITALGVSAVPIACWDFENNLTEHTGTFTATSGSTPQYTTGIMGQGLNFTQNTLDYISTSLNPSDLYAAGQENWSMCFWVEPIDLNIRSSWVSTTLDDSNLASFETYNAFPGNGDFYVITSDIPRVDIQNFSGLNESYTHICIVGFANLTVYAYVNGMFIGNSTSSTSDNFNTFNNTIFFGRNGGSTGYARAASGGFDEFKFWNISLSSTDVADDYNGGVGTNCSFYDAPNTTPLNATISLISPPHHGHVNRTIVNFIGNLTQYSGVNTSWSCVFKHLGNPPDIQVNVTANATLNVSKDMAPFVGGNSWRYECNNSYYNVSITPFAFALTVDNVSCVENWTCSGYGACVNLTQNCTAVTDENTCGTNYTGNYSEFPPQPCGGTPPSPSAIGLGILVFDLILFILISVLDGMMLRKTPETNRAFKALYGLIGLIAIVAVLALLL